MTAEGHDEVRRNGLIEWLSPAGFRSLVADTELPTVSPRLYEGPLVSPRFSELQLPAIPGDARPADLLAQDGLACFDPWWPN